MNLPAPPTTSDRPSEIKPAYKYVDGYLPTLDEVEEKVIRERIKTFENNKQKTAISLGITVRTLYSRLERYGLHTSRRTKDL